ncbi:MULTISPECIES: glutathione S-transferase family protein [Methylobacteriaceae]|uniref:glutathione S-transferase family protein n=1 Tax=Methylobacteriaceae TaxID=119045 RepID=UPI00074FA8FE|nr:MULTISPECIES: glutathione S-transferase family protein [Methylobacteriaceae]AMB47237.1 glutathione S-transferase [Methylobacterium sp. AMS5]TFZ60456.1 glutathione S-transferase family protein [Methylorubrum sp. Q1]
MSDDLVFYTNPMSRGRIVRWMLEEVGAPYRTEILGYGASMKAPAYRAINPMGKVPALRHGETVVTECPAILAYLADAFPQAGLAPEPGHRDRGPYYRWLFFCAGPLEAAVTNGVLKVSVPDDPRMQGMVGYGSLETALDTLEGAVSGAEFVAGDRFSAADLYVAAHLGWGMQFGTIPKRPAFEAYAGRHLARAAAVRAREIDDGLLADAQKAP